MEIPAIKFSHMEPVHAIRIATTDQPRKTSAFEAAYAAAFLFFVVWNLGAALAIAFDSETRSSYGELVYAVPVFSVFLSLQLLRMYSHLHDFERQIEAPGVSHFLESLSDGRARVERGLRLVLASLLVWFSKVSFDVLSAGQLPLFLSFALMSCFLVLLFWDLVVWRGLRTQIPKLESNDPARRSAYRFFYLRQAEPPSHNPWRSYCQSMKFCERMAGLCGAATSLYFFWSKNSNVAILSAAFLVAFIFLLFMGRLRTDAGATFHPFSELVGILVQPGMSVIQLLFGEKSMNIRRWRAYASIAAVAVIVATYAYLTTSSRNPTPPSQTVTRVNVATSRNLWCALTLLANRQGYFREEQLDVQLNYQAAGRLNMDALLGGAVDIANVVETNIAYQALNRTTDLMIHGTIVSAIDYAILTKASSKIASSRDLRGKSLAYAQATGAESFVFWYLETAGLSPADVKLVPLQPAGLVDHFLGTSTEAVATWEPFVSTIRSRAKDLGQVFYADRDDFAGLMAVATRAEWAKENAAVIESFGRALKKAEAFVRQEPASAQQIVAEETGLPVETVRSIWSRFDLSFQPPTDKDATLVGDVIRRIRANVPGMKDREPVPVRSYFAFVS